MITLTRGLYSYSKLLICSFNSLGYWEHPATLVQPTCNLQLVTIIVTRTSSVYLAYLLTTIFRSVTMCCGIDNILWTVVNPSRHCYGSEYCSAKVLTSTVFVRCVQSHWCWWNWTGALDWKLMDMWNGIIITTYDLQIITAYWKNHDMNLQTAPIKKQGATYPH